MAEKTWKKDENEREIGKGQKEIEIEPREKHPKILTDCFALLMHVKEVRVLYSS